MSHRTGLLTAPVCLEHETGAAHPERPARLTTLLERLEESGLADELERVEAKPADLKRVLAIHDERHVKEPVAVEADRVEQDGGDDRDDKAVERDNTVSQ